MTWTKCFKTLLVTVWLSALCGTSLAQVPSNTSNTPIKIIVPFTPGTGMDTIARTIQPRLAERTGQTVLVQNMPGASGNIGADFVAKSAADGTTLLMGANTMLIASQLYKNTPFNPVKDFAPVSMSAYGTLMLVAHPKTDIKSVKDLVRAATSKPGFFTFGSPGVGTPHHMAMELLKLETKTFMLHVPYRGTAGYTQDLLAGELMVGFLPVHVAQGFVKSGKLNALAVGSTKRHPVAADVPTFLELGYKDIDVDLWYAFFVPAKTPSSTVSKLHSDLSAIIAQPAVKEILGKAGLDASASTPEELASIVAKDYPRWGRVIQLKGISGE
ncbi:MAG: tripartite tricarboxylate transporter substrate binding protein [Burkholderiales bacterium]|jgi:tripartite-type tricarboxylate transporter receptor subunit TctC|nr:tripartite tricarboxylate transporter substrate binding protein [Burkholderiales bacterium]